MAALKITQKQKELIEKFGVYVERGGATPAQSRIMALLLVSDQTELAFDEIHKALQISKSAASNAINALLGAERIEYITRPGDRKRYFRSRIGQWENDFDSKFNKLLEVSQLMKEILQQRPASTREFNNSLKKIIDFMEFLQGELPELHKKWKKLKK
jgi:DNA-binding transcriptional regulator GbsR (MarR family)